MDSRISGAIGGAGKGAQIGSAFGGYGMAVGAVAGGLFGGLMGGGEDEARKLANLQRQMIREQDKETERRQTRELAQAKGTMIAQVGASNILYSGSTRRHVSAYEQEFKRQMAWDRKVSMQNEKVAKYGGQAAVSQIEKAGLSSMLSGISAAAGAGAFGTYSSKDGYTPPWG